MCGYVNISPPMTSKTFSDIQDNVIPSYIKTTEVNMKNSAIELRSGKKDEIINTTISTDGSWQRRGFSSLNGLVTVIANNIGKCIDYRVKTKNFQACTLLERGKKGPNADKFRKYHKCPLNHIGSSGIMESNGILECFELSVEKRQLRYLTYIGDGDTKSYQKCCCCRSVPPGYSIRNL